MNHTQAGKSEVGHGAGGRADIEGVAAVDQNDVQAVLFREGEHRRSVYGSCCGLEVVRE
jgi:hypothetical protein